MISFCKERGIVVTAFAPFGRPGSTVGYIRHDVPSLLEDQKLKEIALQHGKTVAQVILRYLVSIRNTCISALSSARHLFRDTVVDIPVAAGWMVRGSKPRWGKVIFLFSIPVQTDPVAQTAP